ncbi:MAG: UDP-3-O-(3-hydroxymyristoyl)glucosamine N-acyltransferase [Sedimentisphaerales bacterium]|nr:UDP-3-O-(3-hydroxymyristoyl)glucosamine N-acyltransferase [Sedimentisphaerales bacterium]
MQSKTLQELAALVGGKVIGDDTLTIHGASTLDKAGPGQITFFSNKKYLPQVKTTRASVVIAAEPIESSAALLIAEDPYYAFMQIVVSLHGHRRHPSTGISSQASIDKTAQLGAGCNVHPFVSISENAILGKNCQIYSGVFIGPNVKIGDDCIVYPNTVIYDGTLIGSRVIIQSNASIGQDGFGFATHKGVHHKIPQIGRVVLEDDVEIGSGCAIERGTLDDTIIGKGSKIGDSVAIGHGTKIGPHCLLVPQVGVAGSATLGHHVVLGGQVGVVGHIKVGNLVKVGAKAGVVNDVPDGATIVGTPAIDASIARRAYSLIEYLPDMKKKIKELERKLEKLDQPGE